jgi:PHD/YefM family antitoxin component YafN of YafNO toxin-antitoxin module
MASVAKFNLSEAREKLAAVVESARSEAVTLERYGEPAAVMLSPERYAELLDAWEELEDIAAFDAALAEGEPSIPWEQVKADLGWK